MDEENEESKESAVSQVRNTATNKVKQKVQKRLSSSLKKNAVKQTALKAIMPILPYILLFVLAVIIIVGIVMFLITMPGMVMDTLKNFARSVGCAVASWFGEDNTHQVDDEDVYATLDYLEQMGYDLKGYGFLTDYVGDDDDGVERNEDDDTITNAESDFVVTYLISDNYVYTIKNFNLVTDHAIFALGQHIASFFTGGESNKYWSRGMLDFWLDNGFLGSKSEYYDVYHLGHIKSDPQSKTVEIKRGWLNNSMKYSLDGWTGRYGMPIDFLLSIHLATMMPDLAHDMASGFETVISILLHPVDGGGTTAVGYYKIGENKFISYDEIKDIAGGSINTTEAMEIFGQYPELKSPENCSGTAEVGEDPIEIDGKTEISNKINLDRSDEQEVVNTYNDMISKFKEYGFTSENATEELPESISSLEEFKNLQKVLEREEDISNVIRYYYEEDSRASDITVTWLSPDDDYSSYTATIHLGFSNYSSDNLAAATAGAYSILEVYHNAVIEYSITGAWKSERINEWLEENGIDVIEEARCSNLVNEKKKSCKACKNYLQEIYEMLKKPDVENLKIYQPYISDVTDHWYRDVYFVSDANRRFVDYDYEYEAIMKERWTKYETYDDGELAGEYKLYEVDENGELTSELYEGTSEEAAEEGIAVAKKAETILISDEADNLEWHEIIGNKVAAYEIDNETSAEDMQPVYPDVTEDDAKYEIKKNVYVGITTSGTIKQTGEGQRTETNAKIKKMFLQNEYFRYDGSTESAEIITKLRKKIDSSENYYGPVAGIDNDGKEVDYTDISIEEDGTEYTIADFSGKVNLNQDSLNAFSMLENTHTLDADYIYRDFKELIVELGFFEKEELTDETPRLLQWLIPDIGSYQYPAREIDKNEHEFGTMIHSKGDIEANEKNTLTALYQKISEMKAEEPEVGNVPENNVSGIPNDIDSQDLSQVGNVQQDTDIENSLTSNYSDINLDTVGSTTPSFVLERVEESGDGYESVVQSGNVKYIHRYQGGQSYSNTNFYWAGSPRTLGRAACGLFACYNVLTGYGYEFDPASELAGYNWGANMYSVKELMEEKGVPGEFVGCNDIDAVDEALNEGRPVILLFAAGAVDKQGVLWTSGGHFVALVGKDANGNILTLDSAAQGNVKRHDYPGTVADMAVAFQPTEIWIADEPPTGMKQGEVNEYEGYEGNEAVVSPVTGILLEYGTYDEEVDSVTGEEYRVNVDLKYGTGLIKSSTNGENAGAQNGTAQSGTTQDPNTTEPTTGKTQIDKVGYAKILVLDKENYKKLETALIENTRFNESFLNSNGNYTERSDLTEEEINKEGDEWSDVDRTLYGYEEFARIYEEYGIAGNVIYIDGFSCELPDEEFNVEEQGKESSPEGGSLTKESFQKVTTSIFGSDGNVTDEGEKILLDSLYAPDEIVKMASKKATAKLEAESMLKEEALSSLYINGLTIIKEGTVIGRTITDRELIVDYREENYEDYRTSGTGSSGSTVEREDEVIGNYIRIIMSNTDKDIVENVEDYMKLNDGEASDSGGDAQPYQAQEGDDVILANMMHLEGCTNGFEAMGYSKEDADKINMMTGYVLLNRAIVNYGNYGTTIREQLLAPGQYATSYAAEEQSILCMDCYENAKLCLQYDCNYVKNPEGEEMTHDVVGQSGWDQCPDNSVLGKNCFWWVDDDFDGVADEYYNGCTHFDEFFCYNEQYKGM